MSARLKILFVCAMNKQRSVTAERIYRDDARLDVRSAGVRTGANRRVSEADLRWADIVYVMERDQKKWIDMRFKGLDRPRIEVLEIPDEFEVMDSGLIEMLRMMLDPEIDHLLASDDREHYPNETLNVTEAETDSSLPIPAGPFSSGGVTLLFSNTFPGMPELGFVPSYHFRILAADGVDVGHINFRVGDTDHVRFVAGHIGYGVTEPHRGHGYARAACEALAPFIRRFYAEVTITCDPDNLASRKTIEHLGATFAEEVPVPPHDPHYERGSRWKRRYLWRP